MHSRVVHGRFARVIVRLFAAGSLVPWIAGGCAGNANRYQLPLVSEDLAARSGHELRQPSPGGEPDVPEGVSLDDGLSEEEAVATALWNNAAFQETLADLGVARADLIQAGLLKNPVLAVLFPLGPKQLEFAVSLPLEMFLLRPYRIAAAELDCERTAALLVASGLDLVRDVKRSYADVLLARDEAALARETAALRREAAEVFAARLRAGDASELEASAARALALQAQTESARLAEEVRIAEEKLRSLLGLGGDPRPLRLQPAEEASTLRLDGGEEGAVGEAAVTRLVEEALAARPEVRAAEMALEAAAERAGLARWSFLVISGILDANGEGKDGFEAGPGLQAEIPLLNQGQGERARANAEVERALRRYAARRAQVASEVRQAGSRYRQAREGLVLGRSEVVPALEEARRLAEKSFEAGEGSRLAVVEASALLIAARVEAARLDAGARRARADLERSIGRRLDRRQSLPPPGADQP